VFSFRRGLREKTGSVLADSLQTGGHKLQVVAAVRIPSSITFAAPFAAGLRLLDNLPILPKHKLEPSLKSGTFAMAWNLSTPVSDIVGLGPFVLAEYSPGQRLVFSRNPRYFRKAADGTSLPYLDGITVEIIPTRTPSCFASRRARST